MKTSNICKKWPLVVIFAFQFLNPLSAQLFTNVPSHITGVYQSSSVSGDFDGDGQLDILLQGNWRNGPTTTIWRGDGTGMFSDFVDLLQDPASNTGLYQGSVLGSDFFNSGKIDALVTGIGEGMPATELWHNIGQGGFISISNSNLAPLANNVTAIGPDLVEGDFYNDGRKDLFFFGNGSNGSVIQMYKNLGNGIFDPRNCGISTSGNGSGPFPLFAADFDNDGWIDIMVGRVFWKNLGTGMFTNIFAGLPGPVLAVGDFNNDGFLDVLISNGSYQVWNNTGNDAFTNSGAILAPIPSPTGLFPAVAAVGDFDNDGKSDLLLTTGSYSSPQFQVWRNMGNGSFSNVESVSGATAGSVTWGDYNRDGHLDFFVTGQQGQDDSGNNVYIAQIWQNLSISPSNSPPSTPFAISAKIQDNGVKLAWVAATDDFTPSNGLSYNIRVGSSSGGVDIVSPESDPISGQRRVIEIGNTQERLFSLLTNLSGGTYYWSVQAIDTAFAGGAFAAESTFVIPPSIGTFAFQTNGRFQAGFNALAGSSYTLQTSTNLSQWTNLVNLIPTTNGPAQLTDTNTVTSPRRYYRLSTP